MANKRLYVEQRPQGDYAVRRPGSEKASAVAPTQSKAIKEARRLEPGTAPDVEWSAIPRQGSPISGVKLEIGSRVMRGSRLKVTYTEGKLPITKIDAAVRQLEVAITMWFADGDPVSICTLAFAAHEILRSLAEKSGGRGSIIFNTDSIKEEYREDFIALMKADPNFCKHAGRDPNETHFLTVKNLHLVLFDACQLYLGLGFGKRPIFEVLVRWLWISVPDMFFNKPDDSLQGALKVESLIRDGKRSFFDLALPLATKQLSGVR